MSLFGKKDIKENDNKYIANMLTNTASKIIKNF